MLTGAGSSLCVVSRRADDDVVVEEYLFEWEISLDEGGRCVVSAVSEDAAALLEAENAGW